MNIFDLPRTEEEAIKFLQDRGILPHKRICSKGHEMKLSIAEKVRQRRLSRFEICLPLDLDYGWPRLKGELCQAYAKAVLKLVETMKPDLLFINFFWDVMGHSPPLHRPLDGDRIFASFQAAIDSLQPNVRRKIYIGAPNLHFRQLVAHELAKRLWLGSSPESININLKDHLSTVRTNLVRLEHLRCGKCVYVDWAEAFCDLSAGNATAGKSDGAVCHAFDPVSRLAYFTDAHHYSYLGCWKIRPILRELLTSAKQ